MARGDDAVIVRRARDGVHKFVATFPDLKRVAFGARGYSDYTKHGDRARMLRYLTRHRAHETWTRAGRHTPGFWSRWLLWSEPTLEAARARTARVLRAPVILRL